MEQLVEAHVEPIGRGGGSAPRFSLLRVFQTLVRWEWPLRLASPLLGDFNPFLPEFFSLPQDLAAVSGTNAGHERHERRLAGSVRPEETKEFSLLENKRDVIQRHERAVTFR